MRKIEIEAWALRAIDSVVAEQHTEDSRVELKAEWPNDPRRAARRIASHANAAHGEPVLWLIGVDEAGTVPGVVVTNMADWWQEVSRWFDELAPEFTDVVVTHQGASVVAMLFETDRAPFVVKTDGAGGVNREVPLRQGTRTDSISRSQLVRLLTPVARTPTIEVLTAFLTVSYGQLQGQPNWKEHWDLRADLFVVQPQEQQSVFSDHRTAVTATLEGDFSRDLRSNLFTLRSPGRSHHGSDHVFIHGPSHLSFVAVGDFPRVDALVLPAGAATALITFEIPNCLAPVKLILKLTEDPQAKPFRKTWRLSH